MDGDDGFVGAAELAGYFIADAVCRIERGKTLVPLVGFERDPSSQGERALALLRFDAVGLPETLAPIIRAFYRGVDAHEDGKRSWSRHLDQSV